LDAELTREEVALAERDGPPWTLLDLPPRGINEALNVPHNVIRRFPSA